MGRFTKEQIDEIVVDGLSNHHEIVLFVDAETKKTTIVRSHGSTAALLKDAPNLSDYTAIRDEYGNEIVSSLDRDTFFRETEWEGALRRSKELGSYYISYRTEYKGELSFNQAKYAYIPGKHDSIVISVHTRSNAAADYHSKFGGKAMINALSSDFGSVTYVNLETGNETLLQADDLIHNLMKGKESGPGFVAHCEAFAEACIHPDDRARYLKAIQPSNILSLLEKEKSFTVDYRALLPNSVERVFESKFVRDPNYPKGKCVVCGLHDVTEAKKREERVNAELRKAYSVALVDSLTGIRNRRAFDQAMDTLRSSIEKDPSEPRFAVAMFDVNGLKEVNDKLGHQAGDDYLILSCKLICDIFKHSPVFRIGGDEFAAILKDRDYENRRSLLFKIRGSAEDTIVLRGSEFRLSVASGVAAYAPEIDENVRSVFDRADQAMYEDKHSMKGGTFR